MARTKTTGPDANEPATTSLEREAVLDGAPIAAPAAHGAPNPSKAAKSKASGRNRTTKRMKGTLEIQRDVPILYEALIYGIDQKVDHAAVARVIGINTPAARMRFTRLMKKIEASYAGVEEEGDVVEEQEKEDTTPENEDNDSNAAAKEEN